MPMTKLQTLLNALAYYTRFKIGSGDPRLPEPWAAVVARWALALASALVAALVSWLAGGTAAGRLLGGVAACGTLLFLTAGREWRRPLSLMPMPASWDEETRSLVTMLLLLVPHLLTIALVVCCGAPALIPVLAMGAAYGCELSAPSDGHPLAIHHPEAWLLALAGSWLALAVGAATSDWRALTIRLLVGALLCFLTVPWLRGMSRRPAGRAANLQLAELIVAILLLLSCR